MSRVRRTNPAVGSTRRSGVCPVGRDSPTRVPYALDRFHEVHASGTRQVQVAARPLHELPEAALQSIHRPLERIRAVDLDEGLITVGPAQVVVRGEIEAIKPQNLLSSTVYRPECV